MLAGTEGRLSADHDLVMFDLDGVVYIGEEAVPGAAGAVAALRADGVHVAFVTNNASRTPDAVAERLTGLGVEAEPGDVVTSAQAAARVLREQYGEGARILTLGGEGLWVALREAGLRPVEALGEPGPSTGSAPEAVFRDVEGGEVAALATGYGPDVLWRSVMRAAVAVAHGLPWVASNTDMTIPTAYGRAPGHGVLVRTIAEFAGVEPTVAGKPEPPLMTETIRRIGGERGLFVGDRLDTDVEGAHAVDVPSLLVMTGVTDLAELVAAPPHLRPTYVSADLQGLAETHGVPEIDGDAARLGGWEARVADGSLEVTGEGAPSDWWRVVAVAAWTHLDDAGSPPGVEGLEPPAAPATGSLPA